MLRLFELTESRFDADPLVLRITTDPHRPQELCGDEALLVDPRTIGSHQPGGFRAYLLLGSLGRECDLTGIGGRPVIRLSDKMSHLGYGDVVRISPREGAIEVLYRRQSPHNTLVPTETCNCRCIMCPQPPRECDDPGRLDACLQAIRLIDPQTQALGVSGGEPTMLPEGFLRIVREACLRLPATALEVLTNARMFNYLKFARDVAAVGHENLSFGVPLYSDIAAEHNRIVGAERAFDETVRGLLNLARCGLRVEIRTVVMRVNAARLAELARFIVRNLPFAAHVALMGMEPIGMARRNLELLWIDPADYQAELKAAVDTLERHGIAVSLYNEQLCALDPSLRPFAAQSISDWKNVYVEECRDCRDRSRCGGFFASSLDVHSRAIRRQGE